MVEFFIGCKTEVPGVYDDMYFNIEVEAYEYPLQSQRNDLAIFLNENTSEIIDDVVYIIDMYSGDIIWSVE